MRDVSPLVVAWFFTLFERAHFRNARIILDERGAPYGASDAQDRDTESRARDLVAVRRLSDTLGQPDAVGLIRRRARELGLTWSQRILAVWAHGRLLEQADATEISEAEVVELIKETFNAHEISEPASLARRTGPCRYPGHRASDWIAPDGRSVCGICHPRRDRA